jgi:hypothetical protein
VEGAILLGEVEGGLLVAVFQALVLGFVEVHLLSELLCLVFVILQLEHYLLQQVIILRIELLLLRAPS